VIAAIKHGQCPILALEIADSKQPAIDRAMTQGASTSEIVISASIDHLPMRQMIEDMAMLAQKENGCGFWITGKMEKFQFK